MPISPAEVALDVVLGAGIGVLSGIVGIGGGLFIIPMLGVFFGMTQQRAQGTSLVMHAASASARRLTPEERATAGIGENLIRVSVGLEDPDDIAEDLLQALKAVGRS